jgi:excisionase family DNA binding protein
MDSSRKTTTVEEAAKMLGISRNFAYRAAKEGNLPSIRIGHRVLVLRSSIERMLEPEGHE